MMGDMFSALGTNRIGKMALPQEPARKRVGQEDFTFHRIAALPWGRFAPGRPSLVFLRQDRILERVGKAEERIIKAYTPLGCRGVRDAGQIDYRRVIDETVITVGTSLRNEKEGPRVKNFQFVVLAISWRSLSQVDGIVDNTPPYGTYQFSLRMGVRLVVESSEHIPVGPDDVDLLDVQVYCRGFKTILLECLHKTSPIVGVDFGPNHVASGYRRGLKVHSQIFSR